jgi:hypothetical protein
MQDHHSHISIENYKSDGTVSTVKSMYSLARNDSLNGRPPIIVPQMMTTHDTRYIREAEKRKINVVEVSSRSKVPHL